MWGNARRLHIPVAMPEHRWEKGRRTQSRHAPTCFLACAMNSTVRTSAGASQRHDKRCKHSRLTTIITATFMHTACGAFVRRHGERGERSGTDCSTFLLNNLFAFLPQLVEHVRSNGVSLASFQHFLQTSFRSELMQLGGQPADQQGL